MCDKLEAAEQKKKKNKLSETVFTEPQVTMRLDQARQTRGPIQFSNYTRCASPNVPGLINFKFQTYIK